MQYLDQSIQKGDMEGTGKIQEPITEIQSAPDRQEQENSPYTQIDMTWNDFGRDSLNEMELLYCAWNYTDAVETEIDQQKSKAVNKKILERH